MSLPCNEGTLLVINRFRNPNEIPQGPPWGLSKSEFDLFQKFGLKEIKLDSFWEGENQEVTTLRIEYHKPKSHILNHN